MNVTKPLPKTPDLTTNPDIITGAPGSHPLGTGLGAIAGGAAAGAATGTIAGPVGTIVGAAAGAVVGGLAGKGLAEVVNPTAEAAYWLDNHSRQPFAKGRPFDDFAPAYRTGYEGYAEYGSSSSSFSSRESDLRSRYEASSPKLTWMEARNASELAWNRVQKRNEKLASNA